VNPHYPAVAERAGHRCEYCHAPEHAFNFAFSIDHIIPRVAGGESAAENLALACESCNVFKADEVFAVDQITGQSVRLFHPRHDIWSHHFAFDAELIALRGLTAVGRAAVALLRMNSDFQQRARRHWIILGLYP
jgi:hypothetical protein